MLMTSGTEAAHDALQLLLLLAVCGPSQLPLSLFEAAWKGAKSVPLDMDDNTEDDGVLLLTPWHVAHLPPLLVITSDAWDSFRLVEAVYLLKAFSLVSTDSNDGHLTVSMHPLIHAWARDRQDHTGQHESWLQMGCVMALACGEEALWKVRERLLQSHAEALTAWEVATMFAGESSILVTRILVNCGWLLHNTRADTKLFLLMMNIYIWLKLDRSRVERSWLGLYDLAARNLVNHGKLKEAMALLKEVVKIREQSLAEDHPSRLASQHALAGAYEANGQVKEAVALLEKVVKIREQSLAKDHPSRLASQHALAGAYEANGQVKEAVALLEKVVKIKEQSLAEDHLS
jgi:Tetratricopeptide repeat